jgi:hypothetical protein
VRSTGSQRLRFATPRRKKKLVDRDVVIRAGESLMNYG